MEGNNMTDVVGVKFKDVGKMYYFSPGDNQVVMGDNVIVETARGLEFGTICRERTSVDESELVAPLKSIIRNKTQTGRKHNLSKGRSLESFAFDSLKTFWENDLSEAGVIHESLFIYDFQVLR